MLSNPARGKGDGIREVQGKSKDSFYVGRFLYEQVVPKDHFLVKLNEIIAWQRFSYKLTSHYKGRTDLGLTGNSSKRSLS